MSPSRSHSALRLYRAPWVVPVSSAVIPDGAVVVDSNSIVAVGSFEEIFSQFPDVPVTECSGVILPALVNAHIHLDLSVFGPVPQESSESTMCDWISSLLAKRLSSNCSDDEIRDAAEKAARDQYASGVGLMLDISNRYLGTFDSCPAEIVSLFEMLGPTQAAQRDAITTISELPSERMVTGHAPYSTTPDLLSYIKKRCTAQNAVFSLHLAENRDESLLLIHGTGCFAQFLKDRGAVSDTFPIPGIDTSGVVGYLQKRGILDRKTLCVHCVHMSSEEMKILAESQAHVCLCPCSNRFLSVGTAPLEKFLDFGMLPALGTDSVTSNPQLDIWEEMALLRKNHPTVAAETILSMATLGGAVAMHRDNRYGSIEKGRTSDILHVHGEQYEKAAYPQQLIELLTSGGRPEKMDWLTFSE